MTSSVPAPRPSIMPHFRTRRTATSVMAGAFDLRPTRDVLTSLLNGIGPYKEVEVDDDVRRAQKKEKKQRERERKKARQAERAKAQTLLNGEVQPEASTSANVFSQAAAVNGSPNFWKARPAIHIPTRQERSVSVSPPPSVSPALFPGSHASTPSPSDSSSTTRTSSKRLRTPEDGDEIAITPGKAIRRPGPPKPKKPPTRKGWKGWVEAPDDEPVASEKLINLDTSVIYQDRKTRSGKHFDAISTGDNSWI